MSVLAEQRAASAVREHLLANLPAKVAEVNADRAPVLKAAVPGPYTISGTKRLSISLTGVDSGYIDTAAFAPGFTTAGVIASQINASPGLAGVASSDAEGRLLLTGSAPTGVDPTSIAAKDATGADGTAALFGWEAGGESVTRAPLVAPSFKGVADGWPIWPDLGAGFWVVLGDRESVPVEPAVRRDEYLVGLEVAVFCPVTNVQVHKDREALHSTLRCVRELLLTDAGRQAGRASVGDVVLITEKQAKIPGRPWKFRGENAPNLMFDVAALNLHVRVFERPAST